MTLLLTYYIRRREDVLTAIAIAMWLSVTVSIGDDMIGVFSVMFFESAAVKSCKHIPDRLQQQTGLGTGQNFLVGVLGPTLHWRTLGRGCKSCRIK